MLMMKPLAPAGYLYEEIVQFADACANAFPPLVTQQKQTAAPEAIRCPLPNKAVFELVNVLTAGESTFEKIMRLVERAKINFADYVPEWMIEAYADSREKALRRKQLALEAELAKVRPGMSKISAMGPLGAEIARATEVPSIDQLRREARRDVARFPEMLRDGGVGVIETTAQYHLVDKVIDIEFKEALPLREEFDGHSLWDDRFSSYCDVLLERCAIPRSKKAFLHLPPTARAALQDDPTFWPSAYNELIDGLLYESTAYDAILKKEREWMRELDRSAGPRELPIADWPLIGIYGPKDPKAGRP